MINLIEGEGFYLVLNAFVNLCLVDTFRIGRLESGYLKKDHAKAVDIS